MNDGAYNPFTEAIYVHDNTFTGGGDAPVGQIATALVPALGKPLPAILYDGVVDPKRLTKGYLPEDARICVQHNGDAGFANYDAAGGAKHMDKTAAHYACALPALTAVTIAGTGAGSAGGQ